MYTAIFYVLPKFVSMKVSWSGKKLFASDFQQHPKLS